MDAIQILKMPTPLLSDFDSRGCNELKISNQEQNPLDTISKAI